MSPINRRTDYDQIAPTFNKRYQRNEYAEVERALREFIGNDVDLQILEAGCGTGHWLECLSTTHNHLFGLDFSAGMLSRARDSFPEMALIRGTAEYIPVPAASLDRVFCVNAIHHFPDKLAFVREVHRVLRPGGRMLSMGLDPHTGLDRWHVYDYFEESLEIDKQRYPSAEQLSEWMIEAGFKDCMTREVEHRLIRIPAHEALAKGRVDKAVTSQLSVLTDAEYEKGMEQIRADIRRAEKESQTLFLTSDLRFYGTTGSV